MTGLQLEWQWAGRDTAPRAVVNPLVVILPWVWSEPKYVDKYTQICHQTGWDVLVARWPMLALWFPLWSRALAATLISALGSELQSTGYRPVVFWSFSGAAKGVYSSLLAQLAAPQLLKPQEATCATAVLRCAVGQIFDSGPVDFSSDMGRRLLSPNNTYGTASSDSSNRQQQQQSSRAQDGSTAVAVAAAARSAAGLALSAGVDATAGALDFFLMEWFDRDRDNMWSALRNTPVGGPVLMIYSRCDELADAAQIASLAASLKRRGRHVVERVWHDSPHVGHLRAHPQAYSEALAYLLSQALHEWAQRSSRRWEGRDWTLRWQQEQQQQHTTAFSSSSSSSCGVRTHSGETVSDGGAVTSNYAPARQLQPLKPDSRECSNADTGGHHHHQQQQQQQWDDANPYSSPQQQQQLVMQHTKGVSSTGCFRGPAKGHHVSSNGGRGGSNGRQVPTLVRSGTSGNAGSSSSNAGSSSGEELHTSATAAALEYAARRAEVLAQQLTPWLLASQMAAGGRYDGSSNSQRLLDQESLPDVGHVTSSGSSSTSSSQRRRQGAGASAAAVRISSWPATATAVAAAMNAGAGNEPVCSDSTLLSHSLRCLASSFIATHMSHPGSNGITGGGSSGSNDAGGHQALQQQQQQQGRQALSGQQAAAVGHGQHQQRQHSQVRQQQQQQPFMLRMVNRLRSRL